MRALENVRPTSLLNAIALVFGVMVSAGACAPTPDASDSAVASDTTSADAITIARERSEDLTGDGRPEQMTVDARGPTMDSLRVRLEILSPEDSTLYASSWSSQFYFQYVNRADVTDAAADSTVRKHLDAVLSDSAFRVGVAGTISDTLMLSMMRDAIRYDLATHQLRTEHSLAPGEELPPTAHDSINTLAAAVPRARIDSLVMELRGRKTFTYFAGGEVTYAIAWSDREQRFITVFSCC
jgi:hypothetical protein